MTHFGLETSDPNWGNHTAVHGGWTLTPEWKIQPGFRRDTFTGECVAYWPSTPAEHRMFIVRGIGHAALECCEPGDYGPTPRELADQILGRTDRMGYDRVSLSELQSRLHYLENEHHLFAESVYTPYEEKFWPFAVAPDDPTVANLWRAIKEMRYSRDLPDYLQHLDILAHFTSRTQQAMEDWSRFMQCREWQTLNRIWFDDGPSIPLYSYNAHDKGTDESWRGWPNQQCRIDLSHNALSMYDTDDASLGRYRDTLARLGPNTLCQVNPCAQNEKILPIIKANAIKRVLVFVWFDKTGKPDADCWRGLERTHNEAKRIGLVTERV